MKRFISAFILLLIFFSGYSQEGTKYQTATYNPAVDSIAEALVALAMTNPSIKGVEDDARQYEYAYKKSKTAWLNNVTLQGNLNEFSIKQSANSDPLKQSTQYPRYNIGVSVPLGMFINNSKQVKSDYYKYKSTIDAVDEKRRAIRQQVLTSYQDFLMNKKLMALQQEVLHDWEIIYLKNEDRFKKGEISLESFYSTTRIYNDMLNKQVTLNNALKVSEAKLESLIGMDINEAIAMIKSRSAANQ